jgi:hypothetical protein
LAAFQPDQNREDEAERLTDCRVADLVGFKNDLLAPTIKFNEPAQFWNVPTTQNDIEGHHHVRHQILLQDKLSHYFSFETSENETKSARNFSFGEFPLQFLSFQPNKSAFGKFWCDSRECDIVAASDECVFDMKRGKENTVSVCIKDFNGSTGV